MLFIAVITSIGATLGYLDVKQGKPLVGWWEGFSPWWGAGLPILLVAIILFLIAVHKRFEEIEAERDKLERDKVEAEKANDALLERIALLERATTSQKPPRGVFDIKRGTVSTKDDTYHDALDYVVRGEEVDASSEGSVYGQSSESPQPETDDDKEPDER